MTWTGLTESGTLELDLGLTLTLIKSNGTAGLSRPLTRDLNAERELRKKSLKRV